MTVKFTSNITRSTGLLLLISSAATTPAFGQTGADLELEQDEELVLQDFEIRRQWQSDELIDWQSNASGFDRDWVDTAATSIILQSRVIDDLGIEELDDIATRIPTLNFAPFASSIRNVLTVRGASNGAGPIESDNNVAIFLNNFHLREAPSIPFEPADIERVELISGPSQIIHGSEATAGVLKISLTKPNLSSNYGQSRLAIGGNNRQISAIYSTVLNPQTTGILISGSVKHQADNLNLDLTQDERGYTDINLRTQFRYVGGGNELNTALIIAIDSNTDIAQIATGRTIVSPELLLPEISLSPLDAVNLFFDTLTDIHHIDFSTLTILLEGEYSKSFTEHILLEYFDGLHIGIRTSEINLNNQGIGSLTLDQERQNENVFQEMRLRLKYTRWDTLLGLWFFVDNSFDDELPIGDGDPFQLAYNFDSGNTNIALFAQSEYQIGRGFYLLFGGRFSAERKRLGIGSNGSFAVFVPARIGTIRRSVITPQIVFGARFGEHHHLYVNYTRDFVEEQPATNVGGEVIRLNLQAQPTTTHTELAYKAEFSTLSRFHISFYRADYSNLPYHSNRADGFVSEDWLHLGFSNIGTFEDATAQGVEMLWHYKPSVHLFIDLSLSVSDTEYQNSVGIQPQGRLLLTPLYSYNLRLSGDVPLAGGYSMHWLIDWRANGRTAHYISEPLRYAPSTRFLDILLSIRFPRGWKMDLQLDNLTNQRWLTNAYLVAENIVSVYGAGRELRLRLVYDF